jgi:hypothetical protein
MKTKKPELTELEKAKIRYVQFNRDILMREISLNHDCKTVEEIAGKIDKAVNEVLRDYKMGAVALAFQFCAEQLLVQMIEFEEPIFEPFKITQKMPKKEQ